jgi:hypothetical protein
MAMTLYPIMSIWFCHVNQRRASGNDDHRVEAMTEEKIAELGEDNLEYR